MVRALRDSQPLGLTSFPRPLCPGSTKTQLGWGKPGKQGKFACLARGISGGLDGGLPATPKRTSSPLFLSFRKAVLLTVVHKGALSPAASAGGGPDSAPARALRKHD